jgi:dTDP-glucose 4,6-dehydratase
MDIMKVLITGTTGVLGNQVVKWFLQYYPHYQITTLNDLTDVGVVNHLFQANQFDSVIHLAATLGQNAQGTRNLLNAANASWFNNQDEHRFLFISSDVYAAEALVHEFNGSYGMNLLASSCEEAYASPDFPFVYSAIAQQNVDAKNTIPVYSKGQEVPEWFWVEEEACAIDILFHQAEAGKIYSVGGMNAWRRSDLEYSPIVKPNEYHLQKVTAQ